MDAGYIKERMDHYLVSGLSLAIIRDGEISTICLGMKDKDTQRPMEEDTLLNACSMSKFVTAITVLTLADRGLLNIDQEINTMLTSWKIPTHAFDLPVTIRQLLGHQSGIIDSEDSFSEWNEVDGVPSMVELLEGRTAYHNGPVKVNVRPGSAFHYSDAGFCILQQVIEDVTKKAFSEVVSELILEPLCLKNSTFEPIDSLHLASGHMKNGEVVKGRYPTYPYPAAAGLWTTPKEFAAIVMELIQSINGQSRIGITAESAKGMLKPQGDFQWSGLGVFLDETEGGTEISSLGWGKGFQCIMVAIPKVQSGIVVMTNSDLGVHQLDGVIGDVYRTYMAELKES